MIYRGIMMPTPMNTGETVSGWSAASLVRRLNPRRPGRAYGGANRGTLHTKRYTIRNCTYRSKNKENMQLLLTYSVFLVLYMQRFRIM